MLHYTGTSKLLNIWFESGIDVNIRDDNEDTPLHIASRQGQLDVVKLLIENGANIHAQGGILGYTPLHDATLV